MVTPMTAPRRAIDPAERRARLGRRHALAPSAHVETVAEAARAMTVLHATDAASVYLQARARMHDSSPASIERELYENRTVLRHLAMRRTLFLIPLEDVGIVHAAASRPIAERELARRIEMLSRAGLGVDPADHLAELEDLALAAIRDRGELSTAELRTLDPRLGEKLVFARGKSYEREVSVSSEVVFMLALRGRISRGRPRGTWISGQFRWSPIERWLPNGIPPMDTDAARAALVARWLRTFGPGTREDLRWWTGWTVAAVRQALDAVAATEVDLGDTATGSLLPDDLEPVAPPPHWVSLLPALDATTMGWAPNGRAWYLGPHRSRLFDSAGNAGPTIWVDGRIVGGWAQRRDSGEIVPILLEDVGVEVEREIAAEAARLAAWIGPARVTGSFPTPLEKEHSGR
jgi:hypothetical protein